MASKMRHTEGPICHVPPALPSCIARVLSLPDRIDRCGTYVRAGGREFVPPAMAAGDRWRPEGFDGVALGGVLLSGPRAGSRAVHHQGRWLSGHKPALWPYPCTRHSQRERWAKCRLWIDGTIVADTFSPLTIRSPLRECQGANVCQVIYHDRETRLCGMGYEIHGMAMPARFLGARMDGKMPPAPPPGCTFKMGRMRQPSTVKWDACLLACLLRLLACMSLVGLFA